jgi:hypothetical protein
MNFNPFAEFVASLAGDHVLWYSEGGGGITGGGRYSGGRRQCNVPGEGTVVSAGRGLLLWEYVAGGNFWLLGWLST